MKIEKFEDVIAWQKSKDLCLNIYIMFKNNKDFGFKDQIQRASVSVMNNIAEGFERGGKKEFRHFLYIARASCGEVRSMLYLAQKLEYISNDEFDKTKSSAIEVSKIITGLAKSL